MACTIEVKRKDYKRRNGYECYECRYFYNGKEIAWYTSADDTLYLKTDYIGMNFKKPEYVRACECKYSEAYKYLFEMLSVDSTSKLSEYTSI